MFRLGFGADRERERVWLVAVFGSVGRAIGLAVGVGRGGLSGRSMCNAGSHRPRSRRPLTLRITEIARRGGAEEVASSPRRPCDDDLGGGGSHRRKKSRVRVRGAAAAVVVSQAAAVFNDGRPDDICFRGSGQSVRAAALFACAGGGGGGRTLQGFARGRPFPAVRISMTGRIGINPVNRWTDSVAWGPIG